MMMKVRRKELIPHTGKLLQAYRCELLLTDLHHHLLLGRLFFAVSPIASASIVIRKVEQTVPSVAPETSLLNVAESDSGWYAIDGIVVNKGRYRIYTFSRQQFDCSQTPTMALRG